MSAYIITDNFFLNAYLAISVNCLLSLVSNLILRSQIKDKIISYNTIICCNTTTGSASQPVLCLPPWMCEVCSEILSDSHIMQNTQGFTRFRLFWINLLSLSDPETHHYWSWHLLWGAQPEAAIQKQQFPASSLHGFILAAICKLYILGSIPWSFQKISFHQQLLFQSTQVSFVYTFSVQDMPIFQV